MPTARASALDLAARKIAVPGAAAKEEALVQEGLVMVVVVAKAQGKMDGVAVGAVAVVGMVLAGVVARALERGEKVGVAAKALRMADFSEVALPAEAPEVATGAMCRAVAAMRSV